MTNKSMAAHLFHLLPLLRAPPPARLLQVHCPSEGVFQASSQLAPGNGSLVSGGRVCGIRPNAVLLSWGQGSVAEPRFELPM